MHPVNQIWGAALIVGANLHAATGAETSNAASDETDTPRAKSARGVRHRGLLLPKPVSTGFIEGGQAIYLGKPDDGAPWSTRGEPNARYGDEVNQHDDDYGEPNWLHGSSTPFVYPWLSAQVVLRFQPHQNPLTRVDLGVSTIGPSKGLGADPSP